MRYLPVVAVALYLALLRPPLMPHSSFIGISIGPLLVPGELALLFIINLMPASLQVHLIVHPYPGPWDFGFPTTVGWLLASTVILAVAAFVNWIVASHFIASEDGRTDRRHS